MTRFLKRENGPHETIRCLGCVFFPKFLCWRHKVKCGDGIYILAPRPSDGTRCRDLDGNIKVVGRDV